MDNYNRTPHLLLVVSLKVLNIVRSFLVDWGFLIDIEGFWSCISHYVYPKIFRARKRIPKTNCAAITSIPSSTVYMYTFIYKSPCFQWLIVLCDSAVGIWGTALIVTIVLVRNHSVIVKVYFVVKFF